MFTSDSAAMLLNGIKKSPVLWVKTILIKLEQGSLHSCSLMKDRTAEPHLWDVWIPISEPDGYLGSIHILVLYKKNRAAPNSTYLGAALSLQEDLGHSDIESHILQGKNNNNNKKFKK